MSRTELIFVGLTPGTREKIRLFALLDRVAIRAYL